MSTCADCGEIIDVRCAHRLLQSERANREETERQFQAKVAEIGALDDQLTAERGGECVTQNGKRITELCNDYSCLIAAERARSAALMAEVEACGHTRDELIKASGCVICLQAEVERMREALMRPDTWQVRVEAALSTPADIAKRVQSPTLEKKKGSRFAASPSSPLEDLPIVQAGEEIARLLNLPVETRRALYLLIHELGESFNSVPRAKHTKVHPPTKGSP